MVLQNYQNIIEMTSNMIYTVALGGGFKCPRKIHLNTQCLPAQVGIGLTDMLNLGGGGTNYAHQINICPLPRILRPSSGSNMV